MSDESADEDYSTMMELDEQTKKVKPEDDDSADEEEDEAHHNESDESDDDEESADEVHTEDEAHSVDDEDEEEEAVLDSRETSPALVDEEDVEYEDEDNDAESSQKKDELIPVFLHSLHAENAVDITDKCEVVRLGPILNSSKVDENFEHTKISILFVNNKTTMFTLRIRDATHGEIFKEMSPKNEKIVFNAAFKRIVKKQSNYRSNDRLEQIQRASNNRQEFEVPKEYDGLFIVKKWTDGKPRAFVFSDLYRKFKKEESEKRKSMQQKVKESKPSADAGPAETVTEIGIETETLKKKKTPAVENGAVVEKKKKTFAEPAKHKKKITPTNVSIPTPTPTQAPAPVSAPIVVSSPKATKLKSKSKSKFNPSHPEPEKEPTMKRAREEDNHVERKRIQLDLTFDTEKDAYRYVMDLLTSRVSYVNSFTRT